MKERLVPTIDYTSRDYVSLREDLILLIKSRLPEWSADDPSDFGVLLVESFAYALDTLHYYIDRIGTEAYLSTAVQRQSIYSIADMFNYSPVQAEAALVDLEFTNGLDAEVVIPAGTRCQASVPGADNISGSAVRSFETLQEATIPATKGLDPTKVLVPAIEGRTYEDEIIGVSTGYAGQKFLLSRTSVLQSSVRITTSLQGSVTTWTEASSFRDEYPDSRVFTVTKVTDGSSYITFGDGTNGALPEMHATVRATYRVGGGAGGNVPPLSVSAIVDPVIYGVSVTNPYAAQGGKDQESLHSIRRNAARSFRSRDRAVTPLDYVSVAESHPKVYRAKVIGNNGSSVTAYVVPYVDREPLEFPPVSALTDTDRMEIKQYLEARAMAGVTISVFGAAYVALYVKITAHLEPAAYRDEVRDEISSRLDAGLGFEEVTFDMTITPQSVYELLRGIPGVQYLQVDNISLDENFTVPQGAGPLDPIVVSEQAPWAVPHWISEFSLTLDFVGGIA